MSDKLHEREPRINTDQRGSENIGIRDNPRESAALHRPSTKTAAFFAPAVNPASFAGARALTAADARGGHMPVLTPGALALVAEPVAKHLGIDRFAANRLVFDRDGLATGALEPPVLAGPAKAV